MSATIALSIIALSEAKAAHTEACHATIAAFTNQGATGLQQQAFAACVQYLAPATASDVHMQKICIIIMLIGIALTTWVDPSDDRFISAIFGLCGTACVLGLLSLLYFLIYG